MFGRIGRFKSVGKLGSKVLAIGSTSDIHPTRSHRNLGMGPISLPCKSGQQMWHFAKMHR